MKRGLLILFCLVVFSWNVRSQSEFKQMHKSYEFGWFSGISNYSGELRQLRFEAKSSEFASGLFFRYNFSNNLSYKTSIYHGKLRGSDSSYPTLNISDRNLSFETDIVDWSHVIEFSFMDFGSRAERVAAPYIFAGVSGFYFNPKTYYNGEWVELQPLGTEGQGMPGKAEKYDKVQVSIPFGLGFNIKVGEKRDVVIGFEVGFHKTFTDHIDDISGTYPERNDFEQMSPEIQALSYRGSELPNQTIDDFPAGQARGNSNRFDSFFFGGICISKHFTKYVSNNRPKKIKGKKIIL
jgi:hypothetical protein